MDSSERDAVKTYGIGASEEGANEGSCYPTVSQLAQLVVCEMAANSVFFKQVRNSSMLLSLTGLKKSEYTLESHDSKTRNVRHSSLVSSSGVIQCYRKNL